MSVMLISSTDAAKKLMRPVQKHAQIGPGAVSTPDEHDWRAQVGMRLYNAGLDL